VAQLFEGLTALDASLRVQPALAESWRFSDDRSTVTFRLRLGLVFSDGTPITADDVVQCWFRVLDPAHGSTMASLLDDVVGAADYRLGRGSRADVGIHASGRDVVVELVHPASWFPAIAANPTLAVVPPSEFGTLRDGVPSPFVGSGAYVVASATDTTLTLRANDRYWAGPPSVGTVEVVTSLGGRNEVDAFTAGDVDYVAISDGDAGWVRYDRQLGPQLREEPSLSVTYYGFDTRRPPFDDVLVRRAFGAAVDWRRIALLADGPAGVATSIVPPGIPGRSGADFLPAYDPQGARLLLAQAGYPGGRGFPAITLVTAGTTYDEAVVDELREQLGISISLEVLPFDAYGTRLETDPPAMWSESWIADYPAQEDFLGLLLRSDSTANYGRWSDPAFDAELDGAGADQSVASQHYVAAEQIVRDQVPLVPVSYGTAWALSRTGLLGATESGIGIPRFAGLAWSR
jgi:oligopeptide transport system substrate-binding protein